MYTCERLGENATEFKYAPVDSGHSGGSGGAWARAAVAVAGASLFAQVSIYTHTQTHTRSCRAMFAFFLYCILSLPCLSCSALLLLPAGVSHTLICDRTRLIVYTPATILWKQSGMESY